MYSRPLTAEGGGCNSVYKLPERFGKAAPVKRNMLTYSGIDKPSFVKEIMWHRKNDAIAKGTYGEQNGHWKGCAVGCSLRSYAKLKGLPLESSYSNHGDFETYGIWPEWLACLEDEIFERLPEEDAQTWPERLAKAVPVGVNLDRVKWRFSAFLLRENIDRVLSLEITDELKKQVVDAILDVLVVHTTAIETGEWDDSAARSAESAAWSAAAAARSAARSAAAAAWSVASAESAAWSAESAAWSAESAAAAARSAAAAAWSVASVASAARSAESAAWSVASVASAAYIRYSKKLLQLLRSAK